MGNHPDPKHGLYYGGWGSLGSPLPQRGVITYAMSANRQRPLAGTLHAAFFNTFRRCSAQALYVLPPFIIAYYTISWAIERNEYWNSKPGRMAVAAAEAESKEQH